MGIQGVSIKLESTPKVSPVQRVLKRADEIFDYVPGLSTVTSIVDLFIKHVLFPRFQIEVIQKSRYFQHLAEKSTLRCIVLLIPVLGNIAVFIYDKVMQKKYDDPIFVIKKIKEDPKNFAKASARLRADEAFVRQCLALKKSENNKYDVVISAYYVLPHVTPAISNQLQSDPQWVTEALLCDPFVYGVLNDQLRCDPKIIKNALELNGFNLKFLPDSLRVVLSDEEIEQLNEQDSTIPLSQALVKKAELASDYIRFVKIAIIQNGDALIHAEVENNKAKVGNNKKEKVLPFDKATTTALMLIAARSDIWFGDYGKIQELMELNVEAIQFAHDKLIDDKGFIDAMLDKYGDEVRSLIGQMVQDREERLRAETVAQQAKKAKKASMAQGAGGYAQAGGSAMLGMGLSAALGAGGSEQQEKPKRPAPPPGRPPAKQPGAAAAPESSEEPAEAVPASQEPPASSVKADVPPVGESEAAKPSNAEAPPAVESSNQQSKASEPSNAEAPPAAAKVAA